MVKTEISYRKNLKELGFIRVSKNKYFELGGYFIELNTGEIIIIKIRSGHWDVIYYSKDGIIKDKLNPLILDNNLEISYNEKLYEAGIIELLDLFKRLNLTHILYGKWEFVNYMGKKNYY